MAEPLTDIKEIETQLKSLIDYVQDCERRVLRGEIMDLQGLDRNVIKVCEALASMPKAQARGMEANMQTLVGGLDTLAASIREQQEKSRVKA